MNGRLPVLMLLLFTTACQGEQEPTQAQRISLDAARHRAAEPALSPDTRGARWSVTANAQSIAFGREGAEPWLTLACDVRATPASLTIIRHTAARPGEKAMFPVLGNGTISRFKVDAALGDGEWRWEGKLAASDPQLDVFTGPRELEATLPGGGTLLIGGSRIPGEFVNWCRAGGRVQRLEAAEANAAAATPARPISSVLPGR
ncbi:MAG TPA: hypothetical protein VI168_17145 [Croceibacterium sp.]